MIIIERYWQESNSAGGRDRQMVSRKCFSDDDASNVQKFLDETSTSGYKWKNVEYKYIKL